MLKNRNGNSFQVLYRWKNENGIHVARVRFDKTGTEVVRQVGDIKIGRLRDPHAPTRFGVGIKGDGLPTKVFPREYQLWVGILSRCYQGTRKDFHRYGGRGVTVCDRWKYFPHFLLDLRELPGYERWKAGEKLHLDKDILGDGLCYSPESCSFVEARRNVQKARGRPFELDGVRYPSLGAAERATGIGKGKIHYWLRGGSGRDRVRYL